VKGKLTPKESFVLYGVWIVVAFALFLLGLHWGKGQAPGLSQEISTQPAVGSVAQADPRTQAETRLDLPNREAGPAAVDQQASVPPPSSSSPAAAPAADEVKPPETTPSASAQPAVKPAASVPASGKEMFSIQVGALKTEEEARKVIVRLQARGYAGMLDKPVSRKDPFYRVRVGSYSTREEASRAEAVLKNEGFLTFIKKVK